jgi:uncharacterized protein
MTMNLPYVTAFYAALLALLGALLTVRVIIGRTRFATPAGDGGNPSLAQVIRAHANFVEQVPLALLMIGFVEASGVAKPIVNGLGVVLVLARLLSAFGLSQSLEDKPPRRAGAGLTILTLVAASVLIFLRMAGSV